VSAGEFEKARGQVESQSGRERREFDEGFTVRTLIGGLFVAFIMLPGGIFLGLVAGQGIGEAAEWVTIVLFAEIARRSFQPLRRQEIYVLFYIAAGLTSVLAIERGLSGGPFAELIWRAYTAQSQPFQPIAEQIPRWAVPGPETLADRSFLHVEWFLPILLLILVETCIRASWIGLGYALFRLSSDVERLPFPLAPVAASGATALAEAGTKSEGWRWGVFSTGAVAGMAFGFLYLAIPIITGTVFGHSFEIFPIPFADYSKAVENILPAALVGISFNLALVVIGFVLPWHIVAGACAASILCQIIGNPILFHAGLLPHYQGGSAFVTKLAVDMDFWLSVGIGVNIAIAILGTALVARTLMSSRKRDKSTFTLAPPTGRGDFSIWWGIGAWVLATIVLIFVCRWLMPTFPIWLLVFFGLVWSPINSYISARMIGITGRGVSFPYLKEALIIGTKYPKVDAWYAPIPMFDHGWAAQRFREVELTGTKFTSILKAELFMLPVVLICSFAFWSFFWKGSPFDGGTYPFAQKMWPFFSQSEAVWKQINLPGGAAAFEALKPPLIIGGTVGGLALYGVFGILKLPLLAFYGFVGGIGLWPANTIPQLIGAYVGKQYFARRFGEEKWMSYAPVLLAGFSCGTGLIAMVSISVSLIARSVSSLPY
jgi:hypothetical protein